MQNDDELVEKVRAGIVRQTAYAHPQADWHDVAARAAIAVMREAGWKGPDEVKTAEGLAALAAVDGLDL